MEIDLNSTHMGIVKQLLENENFSDWNDKALILFVEDNADWPEYLSGFLSSIVSNGLAVSSPMEGQVGSGMIFTQRTRLSKKMIKKIGNFIEEDGSEEFYEKVFDLNTFVRKMRGQE